MTGRELISALEREGFAVARRAKSFVWLSRGSDVLLVDEDGEIADDVAAQIIEHSRAPKR